MKADDKSIISVAAGKNHTIKTAREQSSKTQAQIAQEIGIAKTAYQRYECGKIIPNAIMGFKIAKALRTTSEKLWYTDL